MSRQIKRLLTTDFFTSQNIRNVLIAFQFNYLFDKSRVTRDICALEQPYDIEKKLSVRACNDLAERIYQLSFR